MDHCLPEDMKLHLTALPHIASHATKIVLKLFWFYSHQGIDKHVKIVCDPKPSKTDTSEIMRGKDIHKG